MPREIFEAVQARRRAELRSALVGILPASEKQLILEIGCGNGHFLTAYALRAPRTAMHRDRSSAERTDKASANADRAGLSDLHFIRARPVIF